MKKIFISSILGILSVLNYTTLTSQAFTFNTDNLFNGGNGSDGITFNIQATNSVIIKDIKNVFFGSSPTTVELWYNTTPINGSPNISTSTGWVSLGTTTLTPANTGTTGPFNLQSTIPLNLLIPAGSNYGFYISGTSCAYTTHTTSFPDAVSDANITIHCGTNTGYGGTAPTPINHPRKFNGQIGYDLAIFSNDDAGVNEVFPTTICAGIGNIEAAIKNNGTNQIDSLIVNWSINGILQTPIAYYSLLDTANGIGPDMDTVFLGTHTFISNQLDTIVVWTTIPNGVNDTVNFNDTVTHIIKPALNGTYTIGGTSPDYLNFTSALADLNTIGVCGPVVFNVRSGAYNEQLEFGNIAGTNSTDTILFRPDPSNISPVLVTYAASLSNKNYVTHFNSSSYITFDSINMTSTGTTYATVIGYDGNNHHISIKNSTLTGFVNTTSSSTNYNVINNTSGPANQSHHLTFDKNKIVGGSYSFYMYGSSATMLEDSLVITNNEIINNYYYSIYLYYQNHVLIEGNYISQSQTSTGSAAGIYASYTDTSKFLANEIHLYGTNTNYGIYVYFCDGDSLDPMVIANNMITTSASSSSTQYGIGHYNSSNVVVYHNSVNILGLSASNATALYIFGAGGYNGNKIINNIFANSAGGHTAEINSTGIGGNYIKRSDKNIFYSTGPNLFRVGSTFLTSLSSWNSTALLDSNSYVTNPDFFSNQDLHTDNLTVNNNGDTTLGIVVDIDGDVRPHPSGNQVDIGADEFLVVVANDNAGAINVLPNIPCPGSQSVEAVIKNFGINQIDSVIVNWSVNGIIQPSFQYYGLLDTLGGTGQIQDTVVIGTYTFTSNVNDTIAIWTTLPNGVIDTNTYNDSTFKILTPALGGIYTIGGVGADFANFNAAVNALNNYGICGPVVFYVKDSIYIEQITIGTITGISAINTITFMPNPSNILPVELKYSPTSSITNFTIMFNGASYIYFDSIIISSNGTTYSTVLAFDGANDHIGFTHCEVKNTPPTSSSTNNALVYNYSGSTNLTSHINFTNNKFDGGSYTFYWYGGSTTMKEDSLVILNNEIKNFYYAGLYLNYQDHSIINGNLIEQKTTGVSTSYGIYNYYADNFTIEKNIIQLYGNSTNYGIYLYYNYASPSAPSKLINNIIVTGANTTSTTYGLAVYYCDYINIYHNSVNTQGTSINSTALYLLGSSTNYGVKLINNIFASKNGGLAVEIISGSNSTFTGTNHNVYHSTASHAFEISSTPVNTMAAWTAATSFDANSYLGDPQFTSARDLHINGILANDNGDNTLGVTTDFENDPRPFGISTVVDRGADEFDPPFCPNPAGFTIYNVGADSLLITWLSGPNDSVWQLEYGIHGFTMGTGTKLTINTNPYIVTNLTPDTHYDFYLRTRCFTNDSSGWVGPYSDTTLELCKKAPFLTILHEDSTFIDVGWNIDTTHSSYVVEYGPVGFTPGTGVVLASPTNFLRVGGLTPQTHYQFYVRAICITGDTSGYEGPALGKTKCAGLINLPYFTNFDGLASATGSACLTTEYLTECFINDNVNTAYWQPRTGSTPSSSTGPTGDRTSGSGTYVYLEGSGCYNSVNKMITPYFNLSVPIPSLDFSYHMYGANMGILRVVAETKAGNQFTQFVKIGNQGNQWFDTTISLLTLKDSVVRFLIIGHVGSNTLSDIAIDDWRVYDASPASIGEVDLDDQFVVYPNPNNGEFTLKNIGKYSLKGSIRVMDIQGRVVYSTLNYFNLGTETSLKLNGLEKGIYTLLLESDKGRFQKRVIVQ